MVEKDVIEEYVSLERARQDYGVVIDPQTMKVNIEATKSLGDHSFFLSFDLGNNHLAIIITLIQIFCKLNGYPISFPNNPSSFRDEIVP